MSGKLKTADGAYVLEFESILEEEESQEYTVASHPTVDQSTVTDNVERSPKELEVVGRITATPSRKVESNPTLPEVGDERLDYAKDLVEFFANSPPVQYFSPRFGPTLDMVFADHSTSLVRQSHLDVQFKLVEVKRARRTEVELPPEVVPKATDEPLKDAGEQATDDTDAESVESSDTKAASGLFQVDRWAESIGFDFLSQTN